MCSEIVSGALTVKITSNSMRISSEVKNHNLIDATGSLQEMICPQHDKLLEIYCHTDQQCICMLCFVDEHKNHDTVSIGAERKEKQ
ncbi:hypothetical protein M9458_007439, partial [Cirrhinus mrigala]